MSPDSRCYVPVSYDDTLLTSEQQSRRARYSLANSEMSYKKRVIIGQCYSLDNITGLRVSRMTGLKEWTASFWRNVHSWFAQQLNEQKSKGTITALDGVRALAFLLVFEIHINHAGVKAKARTPSSAVIVPFD